MHTTRDGCHFCNNGCGRYGHNHSNTSIQTTITQIMPAAICCNNKLTASYWAYRKSDPSGNHDHYRNSSFTRNTKARLFDVLSLPLVLSHSDSFIPDLRTKPCRHDGSNPGLYAASNPTSGRRQSCDESIGHSTDLRVGMTGRCFQKTNRESRR